MAARICDRLNRSDGSGGAVPRNLAAAFANDVDILRARLWSRACGRYAEPHMMRSRMPGPVDALRTPMPEPESTAQTQRRVTSAEIMEHARHMQCRASQRAETMPRGCRSRNGAAETLALSSAECDSASVCRNPSKPSNDGVGASTRRCWRVLKCSSSRSLLACVLYGSCRVSNHTSRPHHDSSSLGPQFPP